MQPGHQRLTVGTAVVDITPRLRDAPSDRIYLSGYVARMGHAEGVHDPLSARALALSDGDQQALLVVCDLLGLAPGFSAQTRREIAKTTGIPEDAVMLACTHTHSGPATLTLHQCGAVSPRYLAALRPKLVAVAQDAIATLKPVRLNLGSAALPEGAYNRRQDGEVIDTAVEMAWLRDLSGETVAILVNYGCHPVVMTADNLQISADYPGAVVRALEARHGGTAFFLTGADGNVDPVRRGSFADVTWLGEVLADAVDQALIQPNARSGRFEGAAEKPSVGAALEMLELPFLPLPTVAQLTALRDAAKANLTAIAAPQETVEAKVQRARITWAEETLAQVQDGAAPTTVRAPVQVVGMGKMALVGIPGELFSGLGRQIKDATADVHTFIVGYANEGVGYIPDRSAYERGGYEVAEAYRYYGAPAAPAPEAGELIVDASVRMVRQTVR
jgi:neutral ceramidase